MRWLRGKAIYIDTEGSFMVECVFQIAKACIEDLLESRVFQQQDYQACRERMQPKTFLTNIFYFRFCSYTEQIALINDLEKFITENRDV
ncbi:Dna repair protein rad51 like, partial [Thalictrum thalictroides]